MKESKAIFLLLAASLLWGFAFAFQSQAADVIGPLSYNGIRMIIGGLVLSPIAIKILKKESKTYRKRLLMHGSVCGVLLITAATIQQYGIGYTTAGKAGFITSLYTLLVSVFSVILGQKVSKRIWACVFTGLFGVFLLSINGETGIGKGDAIMFVCAVFFAIHIMYLDRFGKEFNGVDLSMVQFLTGGLLAFTLGLGFETTTAATVKAALVPILYAGVCSCGLAYTFQVVGQKYVQPTKATLALSLESFWAAVGGAIILGESMSLKEILGAVILFSAVIVAQLPQKKRT